MMADTDYVDEEVTEHVVATHFIQAEDGMIETQLLTTDVVEPAAKRIKLDEEGLLQISDASVSIKQILFNINQAICLRLDAIENKLESVSNATRALEQKLEDISQGQVRQEFANTSTGSLLSPSPSKHNRSVMETSTVTITPGGLVTRKSGAMVVGLPQPKTSPSRLGNLPSTSNDSMNEDADDIDNGPDKYVISLAGSKNVGSPLDQGIHNLGPNVMLITLNSEEDFPTGTWLGDESNPEMRVRVPVTPSDLLHIHSNCRTAEKMALTLLDYLFDRETQAYSNLSGIGKHGKKQLDPLMIYGIRCHLIHHFAITEQDWHRLKQNINSKCRTAFRRKIRGLPLTVKAFRGKAPPTYIHISGTGVTTRIHAHDLGDSDDSLQQGDDELHIQTEVDVSQTGLLSSAADLLSSTGGHIQVLHATPEQVAQLQQTHQIQILQGDQIMHFQTGDHTESIHVAVPMGTDENDSIQVIHADNGETLTLGAGTVITEVTHDIDVHGLKVEENEDSDV